MHGQPYKEWDVDLDHRFFFFIYKSVIDWDHW
jgi:hypothetical protein